MALEAAFQYVAGSLYGSILRAIVNDNDLDLGIGLGNSAADRLGDILFRVVCGNDNADERISWRELAVRANGCRTGQCLRGGAGRPSLQTRGDDCRGLASTRVIEN